MKQSSGHILFVDNNSAYKVIGYDLYVSNDNGNCWKFLLSIPATKKSRFFSTFSLTRRLLRKGVYKMMKYGENFIVFSDKKIFLVDLVNEKIQCLGLFKGSRPLYPCIHHDVLYYGEYKSNLGREPVSVHSYNFFLKSWSVSYQIEGVRHIHGLFSDPYEKNRVWITTGDLDHESKILYTDDEFKSVNPFLEGKQSYRAIYIHFDDTSITYGTDAPDQSNKILTVSRSDGSVLDQVDVGGPVFYGGVAGDLKILTTAVEPSDINVSPYMELWVHQNDKGWHLAYRLKKDFFPKKLFQYGQILLPEGPGVDGKLSFTPIAGKLDYKTIFSDTKNVLKSMHG